MGNHWIRVLFASDFEDIRFSAEVELTGLLACKKSALFKNNGRRLKLTVVAKTLSRRANFCVVPDIPTLVASTAAE